MSDERELVIEYIFDELRRAEEKHPCWPENIFEQLAIVGEEFGELQQAVLQAKYENKSHEYVKEEGVQLAAMALRFLFNMKENSMFVSEDKYDDMRARGFYPDEINLNDVYPRRRKVNDGR